MLPFDKTSHHACIQNNLPSLELTGAPPKLAPLPPPLMICGPPPKLHRQPPPWKNYDHRSHHTKATNTLNPNSQAQSGQCSPSTTRASIGKPGLCCSQWRYCGSSVDHCGACCQSGACLNAHKQSVTRPPLGVDGSGGGQMCCGVVWEFE